MVKSIESKIARKIRHKIKKIENGYDAVPSYCDKFSGDYVNIYYYNIELKQLCFLKLEGVVMKCPNLNINEKNYNALNFEPSDDDLKKIEEEVDKILSKYQN